MRTYFIATLSTLLFITSCTKEINMDLSNAEPKIVIEADLSTDSTETYALISTTKNFSDTTTFNGVDDALVTITDITTSKTDTLKPTTSSFHKKGLYKKSRLTGSAGHNYLLSVSYQSKVYTAQATILPAVNLDSLTFALIPGNGSPQGAKNSPNRAVLIITPRYKLEDLSQPSYLQFVITKTDSVPTQADIKYQVTDTVMKNINIRSSVNYAQFSLAVPLQMRVNTSTIKRIKVSLQHIDQLTFDYMFGLIQNVQQFSASPANPKSNISNGALGYFKAHTSSIKEIVVK